MSRRNNIADYKNTTIANGRNIWTGLFELKWFGTEYFRSIARFGSISWMIGRENGSPGPAPPLREIPVLGENVRSGIAPLHDRSNGILGSLEPKTGGQSLPQNSMRSAALFRAFRQEMRAWLETMDKLEDPAAQLSEAQRQHLFEVQEVRYQRCQNSLDKLLRAKRSSHTTQMKVDAFCEYAAAHLCDNERFAVYALLVIRELTQLSGLSPAAIDRLGGTCRALDMALSEVGCGDRHTSR